MNAIMRTQYWKKADEAHTQCVLCPRHCKLAEGQHGFCFVRACQNGEIVLTTYGRSSGFCVDPIEKKPLYHFLPGSAVLSFGTAGCNLGCQFCQNWDISKAKENDILADTASPLQIAQAAKKSGCRSVAFTYNEPHIFHEYAIDTAKECHKLGIKTVAVTAGYVSPEPRKEFYQWMDAANVDLKGFTEDFYWKYTASHLAPVLETLVYLKKETRVWLEITTLLIPTLNDSEKEIESMTQWIAQNLGPDVPLHFTAYYPAWKTDLPPTPLATLIKARQIARKNGLRYVYTGNVHNPEGEATHCHGCGKTLIGREGFEITQWNLIPRSMNSHGVSPVMPDKRSAIRHPDIGSRVEARDDNSPTNLLNNVLKEGKCKFCAEPCAGVFEPTPGSWGARRLPMRPATE